MLGLGLWNLAGVLHHVLLNHEEIACLLYLQKTCQVDNELPAFVKALSHLSNRSEYIAGSCGAGCAQVFHHNSFPRFDTRENSWARSKI